MYDEDLAAIHDLGFSDHAAGMTEGILTVLRDGGIEEGLVVELGCGSGVTAAGLVAAGYDVLGVDQSEALLARARARVPDSRLCHGSLFEVEIPPCSAVISVGECLGYRPARRSGTEGLIRLLHRVYEALAPGGLLLFDLVTPGVPSKKIAFRQDEEWAIVSESRRDMAGSWLRRDITTFVRDGDGFRRRRETHHVQLYRPAPMVARLEEIGFEVTAASSLGSHELLPGRVVFTAHRR